MKAGGKGHAAGGPPAPAPRAAAAAEVARAAGPDRIAELQRAGGNRATRQLLDGDPRVVQRRSIAGRSAGPAPGEIAAHATQGLGGPLPHRAQIQASFGDHDVSQIRAFVGGPAAGAASSLGAEAFAYGDSVAFAASPDLRTAAHEAAHVVQQRRGVRLADGIDRPGDVHERHADAVADAVSSGRSAQHLLDALGDGGPAAPSIQRRPSLSVTPSLYLRRHGERANRATALRIALSAKVRDVEQVELDVLVEAYGIPRERAREFDLFGIEVDPPGSPGITNADLQISGGLVPIGVSPKLDEYLRMAAARLEQAGDRSTASAAPAPAPAPAPPAPAPPPGGKPPAPPPAPRGAAPEPASQEPPHDGAKGGTKGGSPDGSKDSTTTIKIPDRLKSMFPKPTVIVAMTDREAYQKALDELMAMSDEDLTNFAVLITHVTNNAARFLASVQLYKKMKEHYAAVLERALDDAAQHQAPPEHADRDTTSGPTDPANFKRWTSADKERIARERMSELRNEQLVEMVKHPGETLKEIGKGIVRLDLQVADVNKSIQDITTAKGGYETAAKVAGAGSKTSALFAGMLAVLSVVAILTPGVNVAFLMEASFVLMMSAAVLSMAEAELYVKAAGQADSVAAFDADVQHGAEAQTRAYMAIAAMGVAVAGGLIARIPLGARLGTVGQVLGRARASITKAVGDAWMSVRTKLATDLRTAMAGLREALTQESVRIAQLRAQLDALSAKAFYEKIQTDKALRESVGLSEDAAKRLGELANTPQGQGPTAEVFDQMRASLGEGTALADRQLDGVLAKVESHAKNVEAATSQAELAKALTAAELELDQVMLGLGMEEQNAAHTVTKMAELARKHGAAPTKPRVPSGPNANAQVPLPTEVVPPEPVSLARPGSKEAAVRASLPVDDQVGFDRWIARQRELGNDPEALLARLELDKVRAASANEARKYRGEVARGEQAARVRARATDDPLNPTLEVVEHVGDVELRYETKVTGRPDGKEITHAQKIAAETHEPIKLFGDTASKLKYPGIDGTIGDPPRPLQLKTGHPGANAEWPRHAAQEAHAKARSSGYSQVEVEILAPGKTVAEIEAAWNVEPTPTPTRPGHKLAAIFDDDTLARVTVRCADGVFRPTKANTLTRPPGAGGPSTPPPAPGSSTPPPAPGSSTPPPAPGAGGPSPGGGGAARGKVIFEPFVGDSLDSSTRLLTENPGSQVVASEATLPPSPDKIQAFQARGGRFLQDRFGASLADNSLDELRVRFPLPHEKSTELGLSLTREQLADPVKAIEVIKAKEASIESLQNLAPQALRTLRPGAAIETVFAEKAIVFEVKAAKNLRWTDPATGVTYQFEVVAEPRLVPRAQANAPHSGLGIPPTTTEVYVATLRKAPVPTATTTKPPPPPGPTR